MRLGFSVRVLGKPGLRAYDARRPASSPHLSVSLAHLRDVFSYLVSAEIRMYRMAADLAPYMTHPDWPQLHYQIEECEDDLTAIGALARDHAIRLSFHAPSHVALASHDRSIVDHSIALLDILARILDGMDQPPEAVIVVHLGGSSGGVDAAIGRWVQSWETMSEAIQRRLVLEHDADSLTLPAALRIYAATGVPIVFDYLHFLLNNPARWPLDEGLASALATWPFGIRPKVHFSTARTEMRAVRRLDELSGRHRWALSPPRPGHHADYLSPWEFATFARAGAGLCDFDVLLEAKAGDLALLRLRDDVDRYLPEVKTLVDPLEVAG